MNEALAPTLEAYGIGVGDEVAVATSTVVVLDGYHFYDGESASLESEREDLEMQSHSNSFKHTVSHDTIDLWFHILGGMEEERVPQGRFQSWRQGTRQSRHSGLAPSPSPPQSDHDNKPTDHWML